MTFEPIISVVLIRLNTIVTSITDKSVKLILGRKSGWNCKARRGEIMELDDVDGSIAFVKRKSKQYDRVDTLAYSDEDEIAQNFRLIQKAFELNYMKLK